MGKIGASVTDVLRHAAQDIRQSWESLWFGEPVTPDSPAPQQEPRREDFARFFGERQEAARELPPVEIDRNIDR